MRIKSIYIHSWFCHFAHAPGGKLKKGIDMNKFKEMFFGKDEKRRNENLIAFLIILVITLVIINKILSGDEEEIESTNETDVELVTEIQDENIDINNSDLQDELEEILSKIEGVGEVDVLLTYSESMSISPLYNESASSSVSTSSDGTTTETQTESKEIFTDSSDEAVIEKYIMPTLEGAIIIVEGGSNSDVKANIIAAVEAVTGLLTHKIQVFEMNSE